MSAHMSPFAGKTFELRRSEARDGRGKAMSERAWQQLFLGLSPDRHRARAGLLPFPKAVPPPPPPSEERAKVQTMLCTTSYGGVVQSQSINKLTACTRLLASVFGVLCTHWVTRCRRS
jgi:hypothetical protein